MSQADERTAQRVEEFERHRASLLALAYRMLGDFQRAEDLVQEAWLRFQEQSDKVEVPRAFLIKVVTRLCLNELGSARARKEDGRGDRLPEPISLEDTGLSRLEALDQISMAFLVLLQRLTAPERAALLLHDVFDFEYAEIAELVGKSEVACRQLLKRARDHVASERRALTVSRETHQRMLHGFLRAAVAGDVDELAKLLTDDVVLIADTGPLGGKFGRVRNLPGPLVGATKVAAFVAAVTPQGASGLNAREQDINGQPAIVVYRDGKPFTAILLSLVGDRIRAIYMQADADRLRRVGFA
jgi:RNA polymerase sigma-70 factor (ECF subfamily)